MVRSYWMGAAVLGLAVTGLARGQRPPQAGGPALVAPGETTVTVAEPGKPGEVCKILKSWKKRDGAWVHQVRSLKTGEMMTIEEGAPANGPPGSRLRASARRVFHWGRSPLSPPGAPLPPAATVVQAPPARPTVPMAQPAQPSRPATASAARPSGICPAGIMMAWPSAYASGPANPGRAPSPMPSAGTATTTPPAPPRVATAPPVPQRQAPPSATYVKGPDGRFRAVPPGTSPAAMVTDAAPPRRRLLSRLFGRDKEGEAAEAIFSAPPGPAVRRPRPAAVQAPAAPTAPRMAPVHAPLFGSAPAAASAAKAQPDNTRRTSVGAPPPPAPAVTATRTTPRPNPAPAPTPAATVTRFTPTGAPAPAPAVVKAPAAAPVVKSAPPPVIVGGAARPLTGAPLIVKKGSDGPAGAPGLPVIVSGPSRPPLSPALKPSGENVTTLVTSTPVIVTPDKGKPADPVKGPVIVSGPVNAKPTTPAASARVSTGAPRPAFASDRANSKPTPPLVKSAPAPAKPGDWRQSWGNAAPRAAMVAPRPTTWSQPSAPPAAPRAEGRKPDPLSDPASYTRVARQDLSKKPAVSAVAPPRPELIVPATSPRPEATGPTRFGPQGVQIATNEGNAFSPPQPAAPPPQPPMSGNAFVGARARQAAPSAPPGYLPPALPAPPAPPGYALGRPYYPAAPTYVTAGTPTGLANAFTPASNARPIPADFAPPQFAANGFRDPSQPVAANSFSEASQPVAAVQPGRPVPPPTPGYFPAMAARGYGPVSYGRPIAQAGPAASPPQLLATLRDSLLPSQREWAADQLAGVDWRSHPQAVDALVTAAHGDPAATVRAGCVRALAKMKVNTVPVVAAVEGLKRDADPRVRQEAAEALIALGGAGPRNDSAVRPVSARGPAMR